MFLSKFFDKNGEFKRKFGTKGQGPGELMLPFAMFLVGGKDIVINDAQNTHLSYFSIDGKCLKEVKCGKVRTYAAIPDSRGYIYGDAVEFGDEITMNLIKFNQHFEPVDTLASMEIPGEPPPVLIMARFVFAVNDDDSLLWGKSNAYELHLIDPEGTLIRIIVKDSKPRKANLTNLKLEYMKLFPDRKFPDIKKPPPHYPKHSPH